MPVCALCWGQRIFIFPLAIQLGIATFRNDTRIAIYAVPLAVVGALIATYHYLIQMVPAMAPFVPCHSDVNGISCEKIDWQIFGFVTFPLLSLAAFLAVIIFLLASKRK